MAQVKDFNAYRKKKKAESGEKKTKVLTRTLPVLAAVAALAVIAYFAWRDKSYTEARVTNSISIADAMEATCVNLDGYILQYSRDGMSCMRENGESVWNQTYEMQSPMVEICGDVAAVGDFNGRSIYVVNTQMPMGEIHTNLPIRSFHVASQGVVAVVLDDANVTWINLYDAAGNELAGIRTTMGDSGYPLSVSISPSGQMVCVSYLTVEGASTRTNVAFYNFGAVGQNKVDNLVSGFIYEGALVPRVRFLDNEHAYAIGTDRIMFFEGDEIPAAKTQIFFNTEEIRSVYESGEYVGVMFAGGSDEGAFRLQVYDAEGRLLFTRYFDHEYEGLIFADRMLVLYDSDAWLVLGMDGSDRFEASFDYSVRAIVPTAVRGRFLLVGADRIQTVELK